MKIWTNHGFHENDLAAFRAQLGRHELHVFSPGETGANGESLKALQASDIAFGAPAADAVLAAENIRWLQVETAGYTAYDRADFKENFIAKGRIMTNSSSVYDEPCAQHVLAMMMTLARQIPLALDNQRGAKDWIYTQVRSRSYILNRQTALILGYGSIGKRLAELLAPFQMHLIGFRRTIRGDESIEMVTEKGLDEALSRADHVVNILPANAATGNFLDAARFAKMKPGAKVYNIGRGTTLDQAALLDALNDGRISAAFLDVTDPEPLPAGHPLWTAPNCFITPHSAGGFTLEKQRHVEHFTENLQRFEAGEEMADRIY